MIVEWVGGPNDGQTFIMENESRYINIPKPRKPFYTFDEFDPNDEIEINYVAVPIERRKTKFIVRWPF